MKKKVRYIEEIYTDKYRTLYQAILIDVNYDKESKNVRAMVNPNLTILLKRRYLTDTYESVKEEMIKMEENNCELCGQPIGDFNDNGIYEGKYCEDCFHEAQESRLG